MKNWYNLDPGDVFDELKTSASGLSGEEAKKRLAHCGENSLKSQKKTSWIMLLLMQFTDLMTLLLVGAAAVSGVIAAITRDGSDLVDTFIIIFIIFLNAIVGFIQQYRADKAIEKLKKMSEGEARVYRDGRLIVLPSRMLTPGDVIELKAGDVVPADCRIIFSDGLATDESSLTGESEAARKTSFTLRGTLPLGDRKNMAYSSSPVCSGFGKGVVVAVGEGTEIGAIARSISREKPPKSPLEKSLDVLGRVISIAVISVAVVVFVCSLIAGRNTLLSSFMSAVAIAVAAIPEGMPAVVTIIMAMGVQKMSKARVVIRKLHAVETLGSCSCICSDKTGTLTENRMRLEKLAFSSGDEKFAARSDIAAFYECASHCHAVTGDYPDISGDSTEKAIINYLHDNSVDWAKSKDQVIPFSSEQRMMSVKKGEKAFHKGGFDVIIARCNRYIENGRVLPLDIGKKAELMKTCEKMGERALRVLAFAFNGCNGEIKPSDMIFICVAGFFDPPKKGAAEAVSECKKAGIRAVMITGDHLVTARAVASRLGIEGDATTGESFAAMNEKQKSEAVKKIGVFARVSPADKRAIVEALQNNGEVVAMTGDGINDAPGLKKADIGVAMGKSGTEVTKNAADMVIADDNFSTIVGAVREGRRIFANIKKTICFFLATNAAEVITVFAAALLFFRYEFLRPTQLLWINLITDSFPVLALGMEKADDDVMNKPPENAVKSLWNRHTITEIITFGIIQTALTIAAFAAGMYYGDNKLAVTLAFLTMSLAELMHALNVRSQKPALVSVFGNPAMLITVAVAAALTVLLCCVPVLSEAFGLVNPGVYGWIIAGALSFAMIPAGDGYKLIRSCINKRERKDSVVNNKKHTENKKRDKKPKLNAAR